jgi:hypothetical protein
MAARAALAVPTGRGLHSAEMCEVLHVLHLPKNVAHPVKQDLVNPLLNDEQAAQMIIFLNEARGGGAISRPCATPRSINDRGADQPPI